MLSEETREEAGEHLVVQESRTQVPSPAGCVFFPGRQCKGSGNCVSMGNSLLEEVALELTLGYIAGGPGQGKGLREGKEVCPRPVSPEAGSLGGCKAELRWDMRLCWQNWARVGLGLG